MNRKEKETKETDEGGREREKRREREYGKERKEGECEREEKTVKKRDRKAEQESQ